MTRRFSRHPQSCFGKLTLVALMLATFPLATSCLSRDGRMGGNGGVGDGGAAVLASIGGISDQDLARPDLGFFLACNNGIRLKGEAKKDGGKEFVRFSGDGIEDGKTSCSMEIRADVKDENYIWFARDKGEPVKGFLYGSNEKLVEKRSLSLTLYKLYSIKEASEDFAATVAVELDFAEGATAPDAAKSSANLECGDKKHGGTYVKGEGKLATLKFPSLKVKDMKGVKCEKVVILVDQVSAFTGETAAVELLEFKDPKKADDLKFPTDPAKRYLLKATPTGGIDVGAELVGPCLRYEAPKCLDMVEFDKFPFTKNYMVALVEGKTNAGEGERVAYYVAVGEAGINPQSGMLDRAAINAALKADATEAQKKAFHFYAEALGDELFKAPFDAKVISGEALAAHKVSLEEVAVTKKVMFLNLHKIWVHGFQAVDEAALAAKAEAANGAVWFATVKGKKDAQTDVEFVVTGFDKYLRSAKAPALVAEKPVFFKDTLFIEDLKSAQPSERWRVYALKGAAMAEATCELEKPYLLDFQPELLATEAKDLKLDLCEIAKDKFKPELLDGSWKLEASYQAMGWFVAGHCPGCSGT